MAVGVLHQCLRRYGADTLITALQCVTQTSNNKPGLLSARIIKALCSVLDENPTWRESGLALLEAFDKIDLQEIQNVSVVDAATRRVGRAAAIADRVTADLRQHLHSELATFYRIAAE
jgi:hypothetical protein